MNPTESIIKPTVGRKVWYRPTANDLVGPMPMIYAIGQPLDATVIAAWGDRMVNVLVTDICGHQFPKLSVTLLQEGDAPPKDASGKDIGGYVEWMPYQTKQAKVQAEPAVVAPAGGYVESAEEFAAT